MASRSVHLSFFFFKDTATTYTYPLSLHVALPICSSARQAFMFSSCRGLSDSFCRRAFTVFLPSSRWTAPSAPARSEEHTSELQSRQYLVCRLLLEKKKL